MARWDKAGRAVTVVLASIWFVVLVVAGRGPQPIHDGAKPLPQPTVTVTVSATLPALPASTPPPSAAPEPAGPSQTPPPGDSAAEPQPAHGASVPPTPAERRQEARPSTDDGKARPPARTPAGAGPASGSDSSTGSGDSGGGGVVSYRNCTAVRAAHADPIRRGDPGFGPHLDRDGDGIACE
ncbi:excalibur calcium-binding domain-containing protein [Streptomyces virginiae]|uniref:excalibur calcium-binding domain-containing protein n=1 Tax=Streptomyces virginiae TaxID=1961 RepID=UPI00225077ED|nr:excalibur calcium-binding domain-containing protein [Streptomyces virginiae]MCX5276381.1 excalibur calcium-binding domain-containing protein [Streptomyces virginiae]